MTRKLVKVELTQEEMIKEAIQAIRSRKVGRYKLVYDKATRTIIAAVATDKEKEVKQLELNRLEKSGKTGEPRTNQGGKRRDHS